MVTLGTECRQADRLLSLKQVQELVPASAITLMRWEEQGLFPCRVSFGPNRVGYSEIEVLEWIERKKADRDPGHILRKLKGGVE